MGKKKYSTPKKETPGATDWRSQLNAAANSMNLKAAPQAQSREETDNRYKNYDPDRKKTQNRSRQSSYDGRNQGTGRKNKNLIQKTALNQGPHSPYNFVRIQNQVMETKRIPGHDQIAGDNLFTGYLRYEITAKTPILVDSGKNDFYQDKNGQFAIPGSTMRGLIRNNLQILSFSGFRDEIDDYNLMYRAVAGGYLGERYKNVLGEKPKIVNGTSITILENVRAGYIECRGKDYYLYRNVGDSENTFKKGEANYYAVSERYVLEKARDRFACLIGQFQNKGPGFDMYKDKRGKTHYKDQGSMPDYKPYYEEITYDISNGKVYRIQKTGLKYKGYVLSTGKMNEKKVFYVIPERDINDPVKIPEASVTAFQIDYKSRENTIDKKFRDFFRLPTDGVIRPVFYIELDGKLYFGYTPRLRLMFDHTIQDGLHQNTVSCDYAKAIFGYAGTETSLKSRVFFTNAALTNGKRPSNEARLVLAEPKPTSYLEYLEQEDGKPVKTYNEEGFRLRGVKQYWLQKEVKVGESVRNEAIQSTIRPLEAGSQFCGMIRFENLTKEELGLLIWSIRLEKDSQMNAGKAKAYGYGRINVDAVDLYLVNAKKIYAASSTVFGAAPYEKKNNEERDRFVEAYQDALAKWLKVPGKNELMKNRSLSDFFRMKSYLADEQTTSYMSLNEFKDFKLRNNPLPTVSDIAKEVK